MLNSNVAYRAGPWRRVRHNAPKLFIHAFLTLVALVILLPLVLIISASFTGDVQLALQGYTIIPEDFTTEAYRYLLAFPDRILRSYGVTAAVTTIGTVVGTLLMALVAYPLSRPRFRLRGPISFYIFFTLLFSGGLVPSYLLITRYLQLDNTLLVLILPYLLSPYLVLLLRTYFAGLSDDLLESARIDGANEWQIFFKFVLPMSTPALATVGLFLVLTYWNDYWLALLYITDQKLWPLQYLLNEMMSNVTAVQQAGKAGVTGSAMPPLETVRMAMAVLATGPAALVYLIANRYFVSGLTLGALK